MNKFHLCDIGSVRPQLRCEVSPVIHPAENILPYLNIMMMMMDHPHPVYDKTSAQLVSRWYWRRDRGNRNVALLNQTPALESALAGHPVKVILFYVVK